MDHRELKRLVQLMRDNDLVELEIEQEGLRVSLRKAGAQGPLPAPLAPVYGPPMPGAEPGVPAAPNPNEAAPEVPPPGTKEILSPMVGTFYRRASPDSDAYVEIGDTVNEATVICIVEAMKVNNELKAEMSGEIVGILAEDGQPVEFDQPLFRVRVE